MLDIATNTIVKNGADFIEICLKQVLPFVNKAIVSVSKDSTDGTKDILERMAKENPKIELDYYEVRKLFHLARIRNQQLRKTKSDWIWILDDDEFYSTDEIVKILKEIENNQDCDSFWMKFWFLVDWKHYAPHDSNRKTIRFYKNHSKILWRGNFTEERIEVQKSKLLDSRYFHLSYLKKYSWRNEKHMDRWVYPKFETPNLPEVSQDLIKELYEKMSSVLRHKI